MLIVGLALALVVGLAMGLLGAGGSILTVPILVYVIGFEAKSAIAMSLAVVGATSLVGAVRHARMGNLNLRIAGIFGLVAMAGTYLGARLSIFFSGEAQLALFAFVMLLAGGFMWREHERNDGELPPPRHPLLAHLAIAIEGLAVGVLTGLVGVGGGFMIVPALVLLERLPMKQAVGTSLAIIALKSFAGFVGYLGRVDVDWAFMAGFTAVAVAGIWVGAHLVQRVSHDALKRGFAILLLVMGTWMLYQNRSVVLPAAAEGKSPPAVLVP